MQDLTSSFSILTFPAISVSLSQNWRKYVLIWMREKTMYRSIYMCVCTCNSSSSSSSSFSSVCSFTYICVCDPATLQTNTTHDTPCITSYTLFFNRCRRCSINFTHWRHSQITNVESASRKWLYKETVYCFVILKRDG